MEPSTDDSPLLIKESDIVFDSTSIGQGAFGKVYKGKLTSTGQEIAMKKVFQDKRYKNRELSIMKELHHINIIKLVGYYYSPGKKQDDVFLNCVMEYMPSTLSDVLLKNAQHYKQFDITELKVLSFQMLKAIGYLRSMGICHRDIKPQNIMVDFKDYTLKLLDFGCAKRLDPNESNIAYICSRYYRPPELIIGATKYNTQVDVWGIGCCIVELVLNRPIFQGKNAKGQLLEIIKVLGTPTTEEVANMNPEKHTKIRIDQIPKKPWKTIFGNKINNEQFIDLVDKLLVYDPNKRLTPFQAMCHPFFSDLKNKNTKLPGGKDLPSHLFKFSELEINNSPEEVKSLMS